MFVFASFICILWKSLNPGCSSAELRHITERGLMKEASWPSRFDSTVPKSTRFHSRAIFFEIKLSALPPISNGFRLHLVKSVLPEIVFAEQGLATVLLNSESWDARSRLKHDD